MNSPLADLATPSSMERFGRYDLCVELATGGMATVYLARTSGPDGFFRLFAVKRIHPHLAKAQAFVDMFLDEARIAAQIAHPNVCQVLDFGREAGTSFIAMEWLSGEAMSRVLAEIARGGAPEWVPRLPALAALLVADAGDGLHAAHELRDAQGIPLHVVHRDVSPQNLFITFDGVVKVVDFGIASARNKVHETETGEVKGKFAYMAPEQMRGLDVDRRADVWALGVVLYELLTMKRLFRRGTQAETIEAVQRAHIPLPSSVRDGIAPELDAIVMKALERLPENRYETAHAMARDLERAARAMGDPLSRADVATFMGALFPDGRARRADLVEQAATPTLGALGAPSLLEEKATDAVLTNLVALDVSVAPPRGAMARWGVVAALVAVAAAVAVVTMGGFGTASSGTSTEVVAPLADAPPSLPPRGSPMTDPNEPSAEPSTEASIAASLEAQPEEARDTTHRRGPRNGTRSSARDTSSAAAASQSAASPRTDSAPHVPSEPGCLELGAGVTIRVDGAATVEGPRRCHRVSAGNHRIELLDPSTNGVRGVRSVTVPSRGSVRVVSP